MFCEKVHFYLAFNKSVFDNKILTCVSCCLHIHKESLQKNFKLTHVPLQSSQQDSSDDGHLRKFSVAHSFHWYQN